ncbi:MAG: N-acetylneuraminate synthase [Actinobacteria bacterium]|nr:N-acetylneuraminate synthase [Actinomycetota bacterium]
MNPEPTFVIAEAGVNHNGSVGLAKALIDSAVAAGADAVKFQSFVTESLVTNDAERAQYQIANTGNSESQYQMLKRLELSHPQQRELFDYCTSKRIQFLSTPFDDESLKFLVQDLGLETIKVGSGELTNAPFLHQVASTAKHLILSTGMSTENEIRSALGVVAHAFTSKQPPSIEQFERSFDSEAGKRAITSRVTLLHCTTEYPAAPEEINLRAMQTMGERFECRIGFSDHSAGIHLAVAAVALGAKVIEKHLTTSRDLPGPDHRASLEPVEFKRLVADIRELEKALGDSIKKPTASETKNISVARRSLVAARAIKAGEPFTVENIAVKRPGSGRSPFEYWSILGTRSPRDISKNEII